MDFQPRLPKGTPKGTPSLPRAYSFKNFTLKDGTVIGVFQGSRGQNPPLDIIVKYKEPSKAVRTPKHIHWAIDLLIKKEHNRKLTLEFVKFLRDMWNGVTPFKTKREQQQCKLKMSTAKHLRHFDALNKYGEYSVEFISTVLELLMIQEKTGMNGAFMFKDLLDAIHDEKDIFAVVSSATYNGRLT